MPITEHKFATKEDLFQSLKEECCTRLDAAAQNAGQASMLLSGGTSPGPLYQAMSETDMDWSKVWFSLTDERWVEPDHEASNERLVGETLIQNHAASAKLIGLKSDGDLASDGHQATEEKLAALPAPYEIVLVGMGLDGHTASLFPDSADTENALDQNNQNKTCPIRRDNPDEVARISMTLNSLLNCNQIILLFFGEEKWKIYSKARLNITQTLPVSYLLGQDSVPVSIYWAP